MKVTSPVLRGERGSNASDLPDGVLTTIQKFI